MTPQPRTLITIVPRLPPLVDGVGDYAFKLARRLRQDGVETRFIVCDPDWSGAASFGTEPSEEFAIATLTHRSATALCQQLEAWQHQSTILLHYVGYGYARRGCPTWLVKGLSAWHQGQTERYLVTMFHELYASGTPIWTSSFWTSPLQKQLAVRLARLSDRCLTNRQASAAALHAMSQGKHQQIPALPVFSTIGEPKLTQPLSERCPRIVVFGGGGQRQRAYQRSLPILEQACASLGIQEIVDIGPPLSQPLPTVAGQPIKALGVQPAAEISRLLADAIAGFFDYPIAYLEKSTIFAAYCAHQVLPIGGVYPEQTLAGIEPDQHFWTGNSAPLDWGNLQAIADNASAWYDRHSLANQTQAYLTLLNDLLQLELC
ncbi:MAG: glycosyltransferase family 1 protein [Aphanocapsa sp. GSE-SYN-MK-11-07L]|jgi:hypothetical protein|nr:glycosyltransferase family 1 protein [Aphanocapsa sp. GSE-SYN-MK-11-07L]